MGDKRGFASRFAATPTTIDWLNALSWSEATREAYSRPEDQSYLLSLGEPSQMRVNTFGPYRGTNRNLLDE
jgi:hypothetical protein